MDLYSAWTNCRFHQQCISLPLSLHPHQHSLLFVFLMLAIRAGVRGNFNVIWVCTSFIDKDIENLFMYLFSICTSFEDSLTEILCFIRTKQD
jgi:hypothetical protein